MPNINLTCHTEGCLNEGFTIVFSNPEDLVICGGCHNEITDKTPADTKDAQ